MSASQYITFDNLLAASSGPIGDEKKVQIVKPEKFVAANAKGGLRSVETFEEVGTIAERSAAGFLKLFQKK